MKRFTLSRRAMLRGGGVCLALPALEAMLPRSARAQAASPQRFVLMTSGQSTGEDGNATNFFVPDATGPLRGQTLKPALADLTDLVDDFSVVSGLQIPSAGLDGYGSAPAGGKVAITHDCTLSPLLSGTAAAGSYGCQGPTPDYLIAQQLGAATAFRQLTYRVQLDEINGHYAEISYSAARQPVNNSVADPAIAFQSLFGSFVPPGNPGSQPTPAQLAAQRENARRKSVLDAVLGSTAQLSSRLGTADRATLNDHLDQVRTLERRVAAMPTMPPPPTSSCVKPGAPGGFTRGSDYNDEIARGQVLVDLIAMALICDLTRVASLLISFSMPMFRLPGHSIDVHEESHQGNQAANFMASQKWHVSHFGRLLRALKAAPEGTGTVLDHALVVLAFEAGHGRDATASGSARQAHSTDNMVMLLGGGAGALKRGHSIKPAASGTHPNGSAKPRHPASVLLTAMRGFGLTTSALGAVNTTIPELGP